MHAQPHRAKGAIPRYADGGFISRIFGGGKQETVTEKYARQDAERAAKADKSNTAVAAVAPAATPEPGGALNPANALKRREEAAGLAKGGKVKSRSKGAIRHPQAKGKDTVPIMAQPGEFMVKKASVDAIERDHPGAMHAINSYGDGKKVAPKQKPRGAVRHMEAGGFVDEYDPRTRTFTQRPAAPPVSASRAVVPNAGPALPGNGYQPNFTTSGAVPRERSVVPVEGSQRTGYKPNFTMGEPPPPGRAMVPVQTAPGYQPNFTAPGAAAQTSAEIGERFNPRPGPPTAANNFNLPPNPAPGAPQPAPEVARPSGATRMGAMVGRAGSAMAPVARAASAVARGALPIVAGTAAVNTATTPTEDYETRFGFGPSTIENNELRAVRDVGVRALGAASDLGNAMTGGLAGLLYRDNQQAAGAPVPAGSVPPRSTASAPATAAPVARGALPAPEAINNQVTRVGNSYSGAPGVSGDIVINGAKPRGGAIAPQDNQAAENLARRYGQTSGFGTATAGTGTVSVMDTSQGYAQDLRDIARLEAARQPDPIAQLMDNGRPMTVKKLGAISKARSDAAETMNLNADRTVARAGATLDNQAKQQLQAATTKLTSAKTAAERLKATDELQALQGKWQKELPNRFTVVPGGQEITPLGVPFTRPARVIDNQTGQFIDQPQQKDITNDPKAIAIRDDGTLSRDQKAAALKKLGYQ